MQEKLKDIQQSEKLYHIFTFIEKVIHVTYNNLIL